MTSLEYLFGLEFHGHKFGLENIHAITTALGRPQDAFRTVSVAGTNGKGSVCAMVSRALAAAGHRTGVYTSPHLVSIRERFVVDGEMASAAELDAALAEVRGAIDGLMAGGGLRAQPTFFEVATAMALVIFRRRRVDIAVLEVGLGGRLDATTVATPFAGAITSIDLDHQVYLGPTIADIAAEKAGIAKPGMVIVCGEQKPDAAAVIDRECGARGARVVHAWVGVRQSTRLESGLTRLELLTPARKYPDCLLALRGLHQAANAVVAVRLLEAIDAAGVPVGPTAIMAGLTEARWPARLEVVRDARGREWLLDAAHNPAGARSLAAYLRQVFPAGVPFLFGAMGDKDMRGMLEALAPCATRFVVTRPPSPRAADPAAICALIAAVAPGLPVVIETDLRTAIDRAAGSDPLVCAAGSIYLLGAILPLLDREESRA